MIYKLRGRRLHSPRKKPTFRPEIESLESREVLSAVVGPAIVPTILQVAGNNTLDLAQDLGDPETTGRAIVLGSIGSPATGGEIDWYHFTLTDAAQVTLVTLPGSKLTSVLSLYNSDPFDFTDYYDPFHNRLLAQDDGATHGGNASLQRDLAPGDYYVAVSGDGNSYFSPYLPNSGYAGSTGSYRLLVSAVTLGLGAADGPQVLAVDPAAGAILSASPFVIRANFSVPIDPGTIALGGNVQLAYTPDGVFGTGQDQAVNLNGWNLSTAGDELQILPSAPLMPGYYQLHLGAGLLSLPGDSGNVLPLGANADSPSGQDYWQTFQVRGTEGQVSSGPDDTPVTSHPLGDITHAGLVQVAGAIGDDPTDPVPFNPADVDLFHFSITGPGHYAFTAEGFAGRINSPLDVALSLYRFNQFDDQLSLVAANNNTLNNALGTNFSSPLFTDAELTTGLTAGDYYVAVSSSGNMPDALAGLLPGQNGIFDPSISHSGQGGSSTGSYVLNLGVQLDNQAPQVRAVTLSSPATGGTGPLTSGSTLDAPPAEFTVQFSEPVDMNQLAFQAYEQTFLNQLQAVYVQGSDGTQYLPRLESWDVANHQAKFLMLDGLANGTYALHLSGPLGLTDGAGNVLVGNDPSGDFVIPFTVAGPTRGSAGDPLTWHDQGGNSDPAQPQVLGTLFPHELQFGAGVNIVRDETLPVASSTDSYQFQVLQSRSYFFDLTASDLMGSNGLALFDSSGNAVPGAFSDNGQILKVVLDPGTYVIQVGIASDSQPTGVAYQLQITLGGANENPTPLTVGPAPMLRIQFSDLAPGSAPASAPPATPGNGGRPAPLHNSEIFPADVVLGMGVGPVGGVGGQLPAPTGLALFQGNSWLLGPPLVQVASTQVVGAVGIDATALGIFALAQDTEPLATAREGTPPSTPVEAFEFTAPTIPESVTPLLATPGAHGAELPIHLALADAASFGSPPVPPVEALVSASSVSLSETRNRNGWMSALLVLGSGFAVMRWGSKQNVPVRVLPALRSKLPS